VYAQWSRLDNAAKIFPPNTTRDDTKVFRFSCELYENAEPEILQRALNASLEEFPFYRFIIRRGFFWYYFQKSDLQPEVREEYRPPCAPLYDVNRRNLLFELTFYRKRINLEIYHALSDGVGAVQFFKNIVYSYLLEKQQMRLKEKALAGGDETSDEQKSLDAFDKYYAKEKPARAPRLPPAYRIRGERFPQSRLGIIEGHISAAAMLKTVHELKVTLSEFLTALLMCSIHEGMKIRDEERPVSISVPVDLRRYFAAPTARNFFSLINVSHNFSLQGKDFKSVLAGVKGSFKARLTPEKIRDRLNRLVSLEQALRFKIVPLAVKSPVLKIAALKAEKQDSASFSNIGRIVLDGELSPYIRSFNVCQSTKRLNVCVCSFDDDLSISFSSPFVSSGIQQFFFRTLADLGLDIEIVSNTAELQEAKPDAVLP
jgi:hypothetical protein